MRIEEYIEALKNLPDFWKKAPFCMLSGTFYEGKLFLVHQFFQPIVYNADTREWLGVELTGNIYDKQT